MEQVLISVPSNDFFKRLENIVVSRLYLHIEAIENFLIYSFDDSNNSHKEKTSYNAVP